MALEDVITSHPVRYDPELVGPVTDCIDAAYALLESRKYRRMEDEFNFAGAIAWTWLVHHSDTDHDDLVAEMLTLLAQRQTKYGHGNILKHRNLGLCVRMSDKAERLANNPTADYEDDSIVDAWMDIVGYSVIARMLARKTFELELVTT